MKPNVLVLDDEPEITRLVAGALELDGFNVLQTHLVQEMWDRVAQTTINLFILDVNLPDGNGLHVARDIRAKSSVGIIMLTIHSDEIDQVLGLELGADEYISKPFRLREFRARVDSVFRRTRDHSFTTGIVASGRQGPPGQAAAMSAPAPDKNEVLHIGDSILNMAARSFKTGHGDMITLTTMEFDVLAVLARNRNRVLSRDQIMNQVKGQDWTVYDRVVDGVISHLRTRLGENGLDPTLIRTVRGVGYMLSSDD